LKELEDICRELGTDRRVMVAREITKMHESFYQGTAAEVSKELSDNPNFLKGEFLVLIQKIK
jgi:16S rRNA (cytidine1402-2'-O)-methyltransferase